MTVAVQCDSDVLAELSVTAGGLFARLLTLGFRLPPPFLVSYAEHGVTRDAWIDEAIGRGLTGEVVSMPEALWPDDDLMGFLVQHGLCNRLYEFGAGHIRIVADYSMLRGFRSSANIYDPESQEAIRRVNLSPRRKYKIVNEHYYDRFVAGPTQPRYWEPPRRKRAMKKVLVWGATPESVAGELEIAPVTVERAVSQWQREIDEFVFSVLQHPTVERDDREPRRERFQHHQFEHRFHANRPDWDGCLEPEDGFR